MKIIINELLANDRQYESPTIKVSVVQLEQVIASSGKAKVNVSSSGSKEESWDDSGFGGNYDIDM